VMWRVAFPIATYVLLRPCGCAGNQVPALVTDTFLRAVSNGWGSPNPVADTQTSTGNINGNYSISANGGSSADFSVAVEPNNDGITILGSGKITTAVGGSTHLATLPSASARDQIS
jgi:hypothetical protein